MDTHEQARTKELATYLESLRIDTVLCQRALAEGNGAEVHRLVPRIESWADMVRRSQLPAVTA
jgi:hypothetical protein